jgi:hypothetical protein
MNMKKEKTIGAYGASTKGNTLLQWYGLDNSIITSIAERSKAKVGLKTLGTNILLFLKKKCVNNIQIIY